MNKAAITRAVSFLESWLSYRARHTDISGFSIAILVDNAPIFSRAYGLADVERTLPLTPNHLFGVASQTKMVTAMAILKLVQEGSLSLDDMVCDYLPWLRKHYDTRFHAITIRHLLSHSAGLLRDGPESDHWLSKKPGPTKRTLQKTILTTELMFTPGKGVKYSNLGYALLGDVIEAITRQSYEQYITRTILNPYGLKEVALDYSTTLKGSVPTGYGLPFQHHRTPLNPRYPLRGLQPVAGIYATPLDMCRLVSVLFLGNTSFISDSLKHEMQRSQSRVDKGYDMGTEFGLGHEVQFVGDRRLIGHTGHAAGHVSATFFDPQARLAVSAATNAKDASAAEIVRGIFGVLDFFSRTTEDAISTQRSPFNVRLFNEMSTVEVVHNGNKIVIIDPDNWEPFAWYESLEKVTATTLQVTTEGSIYNYGEKLTYTFKNGMVNRARLAGYTLWPDEPSL